MPTIKLGVATMQKDFHYCLIKVLAKNSGFSEDDAQIIAYSSQYTDDSVQNKEHAKRLLPFWHFV